MSAEQQMQTMMDQQMQQMQQMSSSTSMVATKTQTSSSTMQYKTSSTKTVTSDGAPGSGLDIEGEMARMKAKLDEQMCVMKMEALKLLPMSSSGISPDKDLIKLDHQSIQQYVDQKTKDKVRFNFDVKEFQTESVRVTSDGQKIEVHAKKVVKQGDNEAAEEYTRTYELPEGVDVKALSSQLHSGSNTFTVELPVIQIKDGQIAK